jgi:hypothetical protein
MNKIVSISILMSMLAINCSSGTIKEKQQPNMVKTGNGFAVVELFTSEGCSSCPPADEAVMQLAADNPKNVYVLAFHVDYWDYIGWKDVFSKASFTDRQQKYASNFNLSSIYTPQAIVNGKKEFVGSNQGTLQSSVAGELNGTATVPVTVKAQNQNGQTINVTYDAADASGKELNIALVQLKAESAVKRGENKGRTLRHTDIVRDLQTIAGSKDTKGTVSFAVPKDVAVNGLKVVAFVQEKNDMKIVGAADTVIE